MNGPEPITSSALIWVNGSVSATRLGIMKGTLDDGLPSDSSTRPYGSFIFILKVLASAASKPATEASIFWPIESRAPQRLIDWMQSSDVTGVAVAPHQTVTQGEGPGELVGRHLPLVDHLRLDLQLLVEGEQRVPDQVAEAALDVGGGPDRIEDLQIRVHHRPDRLRAGGVGPSSPATLAAATSNATGFLRLNMIDPSTCPARYLQVSSHFANNGWTERP